jgi:hypothetical protein
MLFSAHLPKLEELKTPGKNCWNRYFGAIALLSSQLKE